MVKVGFYNWYPSSAVSKYWGWFNDMRYPELDIIEDDRTGEWSIIQYYNAPIIPSLTRWQVVLGPMRNIIPSYSFCRKYVHELDLHRKAFWDREERRTREVFAEGERQERRARDMAKDATKVIMRHDDLVERIARNGLNEIDIRTLAKQVPKDELFKPIKGVKVDVPDSSEPSKQDVHAGVSTEVHGGP